MSKAPRYRLVGYDIGTAPDENGGWVHWTDHEAEIARLIAERDAALAGAVKVKPLVWENFDAWTYWAKCAFGTYRAQERNGVWKATLQRGDNTELIYEYTTDGLTPGDFEAAQVAAQADYDARILTAIQPDPAARQAALAKAWTMATAAMAERAKSELSAAWAVQALLTPLQQKLAAIEQHTQ